MWVLVPESVLVFGNSMFKCSYGFERALCELWLETTLFIGTKEILNVSFSMNLR